jgi:aldose 1-epimerase
MKVEADFFTPTDATLIPTGEIRAVAGTPYDFRTFSPLSRDFGAGRHAYDGNFVLRAGGGAPALAASVRSLLSSVSLEVLTTEPCLQFYDAAKMNIAVPGLGGAIYRPHGGFCLEPQRAPDAVNRPHFGSIILRPGETYRQTSIFRFRAGAA